MDIIYMVLALFIMSCYFQVISNRDRKHRRTQREYVKLRKQEERRLIREENLRTMRVKHPKVVYLADFKANRSAQTAK